MKDSYMVFVLLAVMLTPFLPLMLKGKCPACGKRKLETLETPQATDENAISYTSHHRCKACSATFTRERSGPLTPV